MDGAKTDGAKMDGAKTDGAKTDRAKTDRAKTDGAKGARTEDHLLYRQWLDLERTGELAEGDRTRLEAHLEGCAECRAERRSLAALDDLLAAERVPVREGFRARVMASLPAASWEVAAGPVRSPAAWRWPVAALSALLAAAAALLAGSSPGLAAGGSFTGALAALGDLFATSALAGAGLLGASWQGLGLVTSEALGRIPGGLVAFTVLVVCLNLLLFTLVRRRSAEASAGAGSPGARSSGGGDTPR